MIRSQIEMLCTIHSTRSSGSVRPVGYLIYPVSASWPAEKPGSRFCHCYCVVGVEPGQDFLGGTVIARGKAWTQLIVWYAGHQMNYKVLHYYMSPMQKISWEVAGSKCCCNSDFPWSIVLRGLLEGWGNYLLRPVALIPPLCRLCWCRSIKDGMGRHNGNCHIHWEGMLYRDITVMCVADTRRQGEMNMDTWLIIGDIYLYKFMMCDTQSLPWSIQF